MWQFIFCFRYVELRLLRRLLIHTKSVLMVNVRGTLNLIRMNFVGSKVLRAIVQNVVTIRTQRKLNWKTPKLRLS